MPDAACRTGPGDRASFADVLRRSGFPGLEEGRLRFYEPMSRLTTFRVGGPADAVLTPDGSGELVQALRLCRLHGIPVTILGNGSNVVVADAGIRGLVVVFGQPFSAVEVSVSAEEPGWHEVRAEAGATLASVAARCAAAGLEGMEFACGIPGTIGGAVFMNAGAYDGSMADVVRSSRVLDADLRERTVGPEEHRFGYRESALMRDGTILLETRLLLRAGNRDSIGARIAELAVRRRLSQPLELPSAGSAFKRPPGHYAGKLISECGLRGRRIGGAQVSEKHAGFIVNTGGATAADIRSLARLVMETVRERTGVSLEPEIRFIGEWEDAAGRGGSPGGTPWKS